MESEKTHLSYERLSVRYMYLCLLFRDKYGVAERLNAVDPNDIYISEVTVAELKYGAANSSDPEELVRTQEFVDSVNVIPFRSSIDLFAAEKVRLKRIGLVIDDFDLLIGCAAVEEDLVMVTENVKHLQRIDGIVIENWIER